MISSSGLGWVYRSSQTRDDGCAQWPIPAATLRERLPETLRLAAERERTIYKTAEEEIDEAIDQYGQFVKLCESVEAKTGTPPTIFASW